LLALTIHEAILVLVLAIVVGFFVVWGLLILLSWLFDPQRVSGTDERSSRRDVEATFQGLEWPSYVGDHARR
jgi:hypothetical protein